MPKKYKVLSVRQPYASLLVSGEKDVENRSRRTNYRGTVLIHASQKMHDVVKHFRDWPESAKEEIETLKKILAVADVVESFPDTLMSSIVGSVDIVDCVQNHPSEWAAEGQWHWVCANAKKFKNPIRGVQGKLGIWEWEGDIEE